jgi:hypothetical protein
VRATACVCVDVCVGGGRGGVLSVLLFTPLVFLSLSDQSLSLKSSMYATLKVTALRSQAF